MPIANVALSNTFDDFVSLTNQVITRVNQFEDGTGTISAANVTSTLIVTNTISGNTEFSSNGQIIVPTGTTSERASNTAGAFRFNTQLSQFEGYNGIAWGAVGGGATGGSGDQLFYENDQFANNSYTITSGKNAMTTGPVSIANGVTITVPIGSRLVVL